MNGLAAIVQRARAQALCALRGALTDVLLVCGMLVSLGIALGFGLNALHRALHRLVGPMEASSLLAAGALAVAMWIGWLLSRRHSAPQVPAAPVAPPIPVADPVAPPPTADPALTAAFMVGFLLARRL